MKKLIVAFVAVAFVAIGKVSAQTVEPTDCINYAMVEANIQSNEVQGWEAVNMTTSYVAYKVQPEPPYLTGSLSITYVPVCEPLEPCPEIARLERLELWIINDSGACQVRQ